MAEAAHICQLATSILQGHFTHPQYHRIGLPGIQGVEAVLTILQDCYGFSYPGGLFLAAVDVMLEKGPVVRAVKQQLQRCVEAASAMQQQQQQQQQEQEEQQQHVARESGTECSSQQESSCNSDGKSAGSSGWLLQDEASGPDKQQQAPAAAMEHTDSAAAQQASTSAVDVQQPWQVAAPSAASGADASDQPCSSRSSSKSPAGASTAFHTVSRSSTPATPTAAGAGALGCSSPPRAAAGHASTPPALHDRDNPLLSPVSAASPLIQGQASRLAQQEAHQQHQQQQHPLNYQQQRVGSTMESMQRHQHQQLQHLLFDAPSEVFTASLAGSMRQIDLSAVNSPQQIQAQQELQQELSRSSWASVGPRASRHHPQQQVQQEQQQQHSQPDPQAEQQPMLLQPQKAQEQQELQQTLQFARQPVPLGHGQQQLTSPESTWQQWQQQQQAVTEPSPWRRQRELQQQEQQYPAASPLAVPQPKHKQPPLSPPLLPPHTAGPAVTPLPGPLQQQALNITPQTMPSQQEQQQQERETSSAQQHGQEQQQQQQQQQEQQQQQQPRGRSPQQLQELQDLAGILQPVLYDDAAASEVLSEWLSGSDVAVADSEAGSDAAMGPGSGPHLQPQYMLAASMQQPSSAASTAGAVPPVVPHVQHFTPLAGAAAPGGWPGWPQGSSPYGSGERVGLQWAGVTPEPTALASSAGPYTTPTAAARLQQQWSSQQDMPANAAAAAGGAGGSGLSAAEGRHRGAGSSSAAGWHSAASSSAVRGRGVTPAAAAAAAGGVQQVGRSPGSSVALRQAAAEEGDDGQSLVLDIDLAKVINSGSAAGTIVLQVRRDESGALTAAAKLAPTPNTAAGMQPGDVLATCGPLSASSPVLASSKGPAARQGLPFGSISLEGSSSIGTACHQRSTQQQQRARAAAAGGVPGEEVERPVHRVLRYSAEGRISIGSFGPGSEATNGLSESLEFAVAQQQAGSRGVGSGDRQHAQQWGDSNGDGELVCHLVPAAHRQRQLADASWVLLDLQPSSQPEPGSPRTAAAQAASSARGLGYPQRPQPSEQPVDESSQDPLHGPFAARGMGNPQWLAAEQQQQQGQLAGGELAGGELAAAVTAAKVGGQDEEGGWGSDLHSQPPPHQPERQGPTLFNPGEVLEAQHGTAWPLQQQQVQLQGSRTQRVSLEPPSTPLAGSVAGTPPTSRQHPGGSLEGAGQSSLWVLAGDAATPLGGRGKSANALGGFGGAAAEAATPVPTAAAAAAAHSSMEQGIHGQGGVQAGGGEGATSGADAVTASPLPPELLLTETPAGFKFWGAAGVRAAAAAGGGLRYNAAQQAMDSFSSNLLNGGPGAAAAAAAELLTAAGATATHQLPAGGMQQQQQLGFLNQSLELLGPDGAALLGQLGLGQISMDLLGAGQMRSLELQMLQAISSAAAAASATGGPGDAAGAQQLAVNAVKLLRHSVAAAATAAAAARQSNAGLGPTALQQLPALPVCEEAGGGMAAAAAAAAEDMYGTRAYQSLDLLPRQLLQSLTAAALAEAGKQGWSGVQEGAGTAVHSQRGAGSQLMQLETTPAVGAAATPEGVQQQMQQEQPAGESCGAGNQQQQQHQQQAGAQDLTSWLADRFGSDAGLQQSVSVLLQELEQQQQTQQRQQQLDANAAVKSPTQQRGLLGISQGQAPAEVAVCNSSSPAGPADSSAGGDCRVAGAALAELSAAATPAAAPAAAAAGTGEPASGGHQAAAYGAGSTREQWASPCGLLGSGREGLCTGEPDAAGWRSVSDVITPQQQWQQLQLQQQEPLYQQQQQQQQEPLPQHQQQQQHMQQEERQQQIPASSYASWSNRVEQLLLHTAHAQQHPQQLAAGAADAQQQLLPVLTEGSLRMTPSPSGWMYGPQSDNGLASAAGGGGRGGDVGDHGCVGDGHAAGVVTLGEDSSLPSLFRTSVMTNPLYWVEASAADFEVDDGAAGPVAEESGEAAFGGAAAGGGGSSLHPAAAGGVGEAGAAAGGGGSSLHPAATDSVGQTEAAAGGGGLHLAAGDDSLGARHAGAAAAGTLQCDAEVAAVTAATVAASTAGAACMVGMPVPSAEGPVHSQVHAASSASPEAAAVPTAAAATGVDLAQQSSAQAAAVMSQYLPYSSSYSSSSSPCGSGSNSPAEKYANQVHPGGVGGLYMQQQQQEGHRQQQEQGQEQGQQDDGYQQAPAAAGLPAGSAIDPGSGQQQLGDAADAGEEDAELESSPPAPAQTAMQQVAALSTSSGDGAAAVGLHAFSHSSAATHSPLMSPGGCSNSKQLQDAPESPAASPTTCQVLYDSFCGVAAEEEAETAAAKAAAGVAAVHGAASSSTGCCSPCNADLEDGAAAGAAAAGGDGSSRGSSQGECCCKASPSMQEGQLLLSERSAEAAEQQDQQQERHRQLGGSSHAECCSHASPSRREEQILQLGGSEATEPQDQQQERLQQLGGDSHGECCSEGSPGRQEGQLLLASGLEGSQPSQEQEWQQQSPRWQLVSEVQWVERLQQQPQPQPRDEQLQGGWSQQEEDCREHLSEQQQQEQGSAVSMHQASSSCCSLQQQQMKPESQTVLHTQAQQWEGQRQHADSHAQWEGQQYQGQQYDGQLLEGQLCERQQYEGQQYKGQQYEGQQYEGQHCEGQQWEGQQYEGQQWEGQHSEPQSVSRIQHLMQKLRNRRRLQHPAGADCSPRQDTTAAAAAAAAWADTSSASDAQVCLDRPIWRAPSPGLIVQGVAADDPPSQAGLSPQEDSSSPASTSGWEPVSPGECNTAAVTAAQAAAGSFLEGPTPAQLGGEGRCGSAGSQGAAAWAAVDPASVRSAGSSRGHAARTSRGPDAMHSAIDDTLSAAEAAMQQALQRIQLMQEGQQQQQQQQLVAVDEDHGGEALHRAEQQQHEQQQQPQQELQQAKAGPQQQQQPVLASGEIGAAVLQSTADQLLQGKCHQQQELLSAAAEPEAGNHDAADATLLQQQPDRPLVGVVAASTAQGSRCAPAPQQQQQAGPAAAVAAPAAAESPSLDWVRRVLQDSSALSCYVQSLADNDHHSSSHSRGAGVQVQTAGELYGSARAPEHAAAASSPPVSPDSRICQDTDTAAAAGFRQQVASRMSALLAAAHSADLRDSHCSSSSSCDGGIHSSPGEAEQQHVRHSPATHLQGGVWQDRIQQLLAAADAAADSLAQPPELPQQQQQQPTAAARTKPPASKAAAAPAARPNVAAGRAAAPFSSSLGLRRSGAAAAGVSSSTAAGSRKGPAGQAVNSAKGGSRTAASAAAIVAARHSNSLAVPSRMLQRVPSHAEGVLCAAPNAASAAASGAVKGSSQAAAMGRAAPSSTARPSKLQKLAGSERAAAAAAAAVTAGVEHSAASCVAGAHRARGASSSTPQSGELLEAADLAAKGVAAAAGGSVGAGAPASSLHGAVGSTAVRGQHLAAGQKVTLQKAAQQQMDTPAGQQPDMPSLNAAAPASQQQVEQLQRHSQQRLLQHLAPPVTEAGPNSSSSNCSCPYSGGVRAVSTAGAQQVRPEDSAVMHAGLVGKAAGSSSRSAKLRQQANSVLMPLVAPESSGIAAAPAAVSTSGAAAGAAAVQQVMVQKCSMFDFMQPKGYTFSTAKARATAELATGTGAQQEAATQQAQGNSTSKQPTQSQSRAASPAEQQFAAASAGRGRHPGAAAAAAATADVKGGTSSPRAAAAPSQPRYKQHTAAALAAVHGQHTDALQQQDSFSSQRSHGLSLRRSARQTSPADVPPAHAAPTAIPTSPGCRQAPPPQQQQQQPRQQWQGQQPQHQRQGQQQRQRQQPAGHSVLTVQVSADGSPVSCRTLQLQALAAKRRADAAAKAGSSSGGSVAAVAAVKAALAGFGTKGWQQQDVCEWLSRMRLDLLPEEPAQPLLLNPLRNGLLLAGIAAALSLQPLPGIFQPVGTLAAARANLLAAAARLGLVSTRFVCSAAAAAARRDKEEALGMQGSSDSRPYLWEGSPGSKSGPRGPAGGLVGLRSPVRVRGSAASSPVRQGCRSASPSRCYSYQRAGAQHLLRPGSGGNGFALDPGTTCGCFVVAATGPAGVHGMMGDGGAPQHLPSGQHQHQYQQQQQVGLCGPAGSCCCGCWACQQLEGTVLEHAVLQLLELVMAGDTSCMWGLLYALQQAFPVVPDNPRMCSPARRQLNPNKQAVRPQQQQQQGLQEGRDLERQGCARAGAAAAARGVGAAGGLLSSSSACTVVQPMQGPSWRTFQLPYSAAELKELEQQLLQWLGSLDLISVADTPDWSCISHDIASGVLLAEVAAAVGAGPAVGIQERPVTAAARAGNIQAVLDVLQQLPGLQCRRLLQQHEAALLTGERPALTALLEATWVWATGQQAGHWLRWTQQQQQQPAGTRGSCGIQSDRPTRSSSSSSRGRAAGSFRASRVGGSSSSALGQMRP